MASHYNVLRGLLSVIAVPTNHTILARRSYRRDNSQEASKSDLRV
jgi:hypothetical protein